VRFRDAALISDPGKAGINAKRCGQTRYADDDPAIEAARSTPFRQRLHGQCDQKAQHQREHQCIHHLDREVEANEIRDRGDNDCAADDCGGVDGIEPRCLERAMLEGVLVTGDLTALDETPALRAACG